MYVYGVIQALKIGLSYFILFLLLPSLILGDRFRNEHLAKRFMIYLVFSHVHLSTLVFILAYLNIFNRFSLLFSTLFTSGIFYMFLHQEHLAEILLTAKQHLNEIIRGERGLQLFVAETVENIQTYLTKLYQELTRENRIEWIVFLVILSYSVYQYGINSIEYPTYLAPDEEVHLYWIQSLIQGDIYPSGVYPHIFHNILAGMIVLFKISPTNMILYFAMTSNILIMSMLYLGLRKIFHSKHAALFGFLLFSTVDFFNESATYRYQFSIPQEYAMIMLIPMVVFLFDYIKNQKKEDLIFFSLALSLAVGIHFYTGVIAVVFAFAIGITYLYPIIKEKILFKLILSGILSAVLALAPLAVGLSLGYELEQSFDWGTEVITGEFYDELAEEGELGENTIEKDAAEEEPTGEEPTALTLESFLTNAKADIEEYVFYDVQTMYIFLGLLFLSLVYNIAYSLYKKGDAKSKYQIAFAINLLLLLFLILFKAMNLPTIMVPNRIAIYFAYFSSFLMGMPLEMINRLLEQKKLRTIVPLFSVGVMLASVVWVIKDDQIRRLPRIIYIQTSGTTKANMKIMEEYEDNTWTVISPVNNISMVMGRGFHYELSEFILEQENWQPQQEIWIPTEYVFLYVEKEPIMNYGEGFYRWEAELNNRPKITKEDAMKDLTDTMIENYHYMEEREILMAKAYYWAKEYQEYFPKEIDVYYEDSELVVYRIKQNIYALSNFSIDYGINTK